MSEWVSPPPLDIALPGEPQLGLSEPASPENIGSSEMAGTRWTPEVVRVIMQGVFGMLAAWRGPHWAYPEDEADPLIEPTATVFNRTPVLRDLAPEHMAVVVTVIGWGTIAAKRVGYERQMVRSVRPAQTEPAPTRDSVGSPYGENRLG